MAKLIMVADDTKAILELYEDILTESHYKVSLLSIHTDVFEKAKELKPNLIILDLLFSEQLVGWEVVKQLRRKGASTASIPIIVCSALSNFGKNVEKGLIGGNIHYLPKPFDLDELLDLVEDLIGTADD